MPISPFETEMTIDNEEQMRIVLEAVDDADNGGGLKATMTPEEFAAKRKADLETFEEMVRNAERDNSS